MPRIQLDNERVFCNDDSVMKNSEQLNADERSRSTAEATRESFHFEEIAELEPAFVSLVERLKEKIERAEYDSLISDEIGGRIPTLVLRKIIKKRRPDARPGTYFISGGRYLPGSSGSEQKAVNEEAEKYSELAQHMHDITRDTRRALIVTQIISKGGTVSKLTQLLKEAGVHDVDVAALRQSSPSRAKISENNLYTGGGSRHAIDERHFDFFGVRKPTAKFSPYPLHIKKVIEEEGRELSMEDWREIFEPSQEETSAANVSEQRNEWERRKRAPLTPEEVSAMQRDINLARKDVDLLADRIMQKVWGQAADFSDGLS